MGHNVIVFGRVLRRMGLGAQPDRLVLLGQALETIGLGSRSDVKAAARAVLVRTPEEARVYDAAFDAFWSEASVDAKIGEGGADDGQQEQPGEDAARRPAAEHDVNATQAMRRDTALLRSDGDDHAPGEEHVTAPETDRAFTYSFAEGLYQKEFASLSEDEAARAPSWPAVRCGISARGSRGACARAAAAAVRLPPHAAAEPAPRRRGVLARHQDA